MDFSSLAQTLLSQIRTLLPGWLPGGKVRGNEYVCSSLNGGKGDSFSVNLTTGAWADFATPSVRGGDLIALYAAINNLRQGEAFKRLSESYLPKTTPVIKQEPKVNVVPVPDEANVPEMMHHDLGKPSMFWKYKDLNGQLLFYVARYDDPNCEKCGEKNINKVCHKCGSKQKKLILPWSWVPKFSNFRNIGWPPPRPLYGLELLKDNPILIVEGERSADSARKIVGDNYDVITWPNGTQSVSKVDWEPIYNKSVLIWPDADEPGVKAAYQIATKLNPKCKDVKIIGVEGCSAGWDAADALAEGFDFDKFFEWAKPRVKKFEPVADLLAPEKKVELPEDQESPLSKSVYALWDDMGIARAANGTPIMNMDNCIRVFETAEEFREFVWFDDFHAKYFTKWKTGTVREWTDIDELNMTQFFQRELGMSKMNSNTVHEAVMVYANKHQKNEPREWLICLKWDGKPRIKRFFTDAMGANDDDYTKAASKNWWISMVARVMQPGSKVDSMVIFEGLQGTFKSTALGVIGGKWYAEAHESVTSKDFFMLLQGKWIVEISELDAFSKAEVNTIKKVITCQTDRFRPPYGKATQDFPRQCIFVGTTNEDAYLRDNTGARRFWPIKIKTIDLKYIRDNREQLFAEAVKQFESGENWYTMPAETARVQEERRQIDEWERIIDAWLDNHNKGEVGYTIEEIASKALFIHTDRLDRTVQNRIGKAMRVLGYENMAAWRGEPRKCVRVWVKRDVEEDRYGDIPDEKPFGHIPRQPQ